MNEQELRGLVREAIERHLGRPDMVDGRRAIIEGRSSMADKRWAMGDSRSSMGADRSIDASHVLLKVIPGSQIDDGMCVIEPAVRCNHCGFCQSYGH
jgi:hypothetical protein